MKPAEARVTDDIEVAATVEEDPSMVTGGVRTLSLVLIVDALLAHVATEMTLKAGPVLYRTVEGTAGACRVLRDFPRLQHKGKWAIP